MTQPLLSICIATYNRAGYIGKTLESIIPQANDDVEILVVDGASADDTAIVVRRYADGCRQLRYVRLACKGGVDQDYSKAVELARGSMCWLFTDDDLLRPGALNAVLAAVRQGHRLIVVNAAVMDKDLSAVLVDRLLRINADEVYTAAEFERLFRRVVPYMSFIGGVVVSRDLWLERERARYFGTEFIHMGVIFQAPLPGSACVLAEPYIISRFGNAQWTTRTFEIWMFKWPRLIGSFESIPEKDRKKYQMSNTWRGLVNLLLFRAKGEYSRVEYRKCYASLKLSLGWKTAAFIVAVIPCMLLNFFLLSYCKLVRRKASIAIYEFENNRHNVFKAAGRLKWG